MKRPTPCNLVIYPAVLLLVSLGFAALEMYLISGVSYLVSLAFFAVLYSHNFPGK